MKFMDHEEGILRNCQASQARVSRASGWMGWVIVIVLVCSLARCAHRLGPSELENEKVRIRITYHHPQAQKVCLAGNFNHWSLQSDCLAKDGEYWFIELWLSPGRYSYLFVVDDRLWKVDPGSPLREDSGFGMENSILMVD